MQSALKTCNGDRKRVDVLGAELAKQLADKGFDVKFGSNFGTIGIHKHGADHGVSFEIAKHYGIQGAGDYRAQPYDWVTKLDSNLKVDSVIAGFGKQGGDGKGLKDATELANSFDNSKPGDFTDAHREIGRSILYAFESQGMDGVKALESSLSKKIKSENGPVVVRNCDKLTVYHGKSVTDEEALRTFESGDRTGMVKHPSRGWIRTTAKGPEIELPTKKK